MCCKVTGGEKKTGETKKKYNFSLPSFLAKLRVRPGPLGQIPGLACWKFANRNQNSTPRLLIGLSSGRSFPALFLSPIPVLATASHFI